jgi:hypothetical protein
VIARHGMRLTPSEAAALERSGSPGRPREQPGRGESMEHEGVEQAR